MVNPLTHTELCHMGTARPINHPVPDRVKPSFVTMTFDGQPWVVYWCTWNDLLLPPLIICWFSRL